MSDNTATNVMIGFNPTIDVPVTAHMFKGKEKIEVSFIAVFKHVSRKANRVLKKEMDKALRDVRLLAKELVELENKSESDSDTENRIEEIDQQIDTYTDMIEKRIREHLVSWKELPHAQSGFVEFNQENLELVLDHEAYFLALRDGFNRATGVDHEAHERKNSKA